MSETPPEHSPLPWTAAIAVIMVLGLLGTATLADMVTGPDGDRAERVALTPRPPAGLGDLPRYAADARHYLGHRYAARDRFIETNAAAKIGLFGHIPYPDVTAGQEGFLFLATEGAVEIAQGAAPLSAAERTGWQDQFAAAQAAADARGLPYLLIIGPNKHSVYPDLLPPWLVPATGPTRTDEILGLAGDTLAIPPVDLRPHFAQLRAANPDTLYYHPTDTHWNELGAALGLQHALDTAGLETALPPAMSETRGAGGDLARMIGLQDQISTEAPAYPRDNWRCQRPDGTALEIVTLDPLLPRRFSCTSAGGDPRRVVAFIDSFGVAAIPHLAANFGRLEVLWQDDLDFDLAADLDADLVLQIRVERRFLTLDPAALGQPEP